ncbi:hypothetical protein BDV93DRAFT_230931 [Ceratobasidium sp. AG-I]|nr:hypothetical protein BDV93DRAFT_230931 [Ceratobasidium sp. AG-I]
MFVLQDCSICFENYDARRNPYSISCGHIFCRSCLDTLSSSSPTCPHCRKPFSHGSIRKVMCALQESSAQGSRTIPEAEVIVLEAIASSITSTGGPEQRKSLVQSNPKLSMQETGFPESLLIALDVVRLLVDVESRNAELSHKMDSACAVEESLRDQISLLEAQINETRATVKSSLQDFPVLLSEMRQLATSMGILDEKAFQITQRLTSADLISSLDHPALDHTRSTPRPVQTHSRSRSDSALPENLPPSDSHSESPPLIPMFRPGPTTIDTLLPLPAVARHPYPFSTPHIRSTSEFPLAGELSENAQTQSPSPVSLQPFSWLDWLLPRRSTQIIPDRASGSVSTRTSTPLAPPPRRRLRDTDGSVILR